MPALTDPMEGLVSFQHAFAHGLIDLQRGRIDEKLFVHLDQPADVPRLTYVKLHKKTVTAMLIAVQVEPINPGIPCFQIGYAVAEKYRKEGRAKEIVTAGIAELCHGMSRNGIGALDIEAVVAVDNDPSNKVATATISDSPKSETDEISGVPILVYVRRFES